MTTSSRATTGRMKSSQAVMYGPASNQYGKAGGVDPNETVYILSKALGYYHIQYIITGSTKEKQGYVPISEVTDISGPTPEEEDYYGGYCYASTELDVRTCDEFDKTDAVGTLYAYEGCTMIFHYEMADKHVAYVEYNTYAGRKRGYVNFNDLTPYHRPGIFPDFYHTTNNGVKDENAWVSEREDVYGDPNANYSVIGAVNKEPITNYRTSDSGYNNFTYIEYWVTGSSLKKCGYIPTSHIYTAQIGEQPPEKNLTVILGDYANFKKQPSYGVTQHGREMYYYKAGTGSKHIYLIFAHHGWEDGIDSTGQHYFAGDGDALIRLGKKFIEKFEANPRDDILSNWSIYVFPKINLDGIAEGVGCGMDLSGNIIEENCFGRCFADGLDPNRNWAGKFVVAQNHRRYMTASTPFQSAELKYLRDILRKLNEGASKSVLLDIHGWLDQTVGDSIVGQYFLDTYDDTHNIGNTRLSSARSNSGQGGYGYLINWAKNSSGIVADESASNQAGLGANACLIEFPQPYDFSSNKIEIDYGLKFFNSMIALLNNYN